MNKRLEIRAVALLLLITLWGEILCPPLLFALTSGSVQPEFAGVGPSGSSEMVDLFTGGFSYNLPLMNVPGPHGSGYPITLNYKSNMSPEEDASWVGYGWNLSPGSIMRSRNGIADDLNGTRVTYYNKSEPNITATLGFYGAAEVGDIELSLGAQKSLVYNNYAGWSLRSGFFASVMGTGTLQLNSGDDGPSFSASLSPLNVIKKFIPQSHSALVPPSTATKTWELSPANLHPTKTPHLTGSITMGALGVHGTDIWLKGESMTLNGSYSSINSVAEESKTCYGFMYAGNANANDIMDYAVEKEKQYHMKRNQFLSIPFSTPDDFIATGSGVGGKFRLYHDKVGTFWPAYQESQIIIDNSQIEEILPKEAEGAVGYSGVKSNGYQKLRMGGWSTPETEMYSFQQQNGLQDEPYYFRFDGDRGGNGMYSRESDKPTQAWGTGRYDLRVLPSKMNGGKRQGRTSYIGFRTVEDMMRLNGNGIPYLAYDKDNSLGSARSLVDRENKNWTSTEAVKYHGSKPVFEKSIGEFALTGVNGSQYVYGLPVYTREENDLAFGIQATTPKEYDYLVRQRSDDKKIGEYRSAPYASAYLLTEVTTPNYVDMNNNGPDDADLGGYTKFRYHRAYGGNDKIRKHTEAPWYQWRIPYKGLRYQKNSVSEPRDDMGSVQRGEKEVYYMRTIETKTHIAYFVTNRTDITTPNGVQISGSQSVRLDACQADPNEDAAVQGTAYPPTTLDNKMEYLEEIRLYAKNEDGNPGKLLKTTHFVYDYSLMRQRAAGNNDLNSMANSGTQERVGKLTLRYVWFESDDVVNSLISPYEFVYQYPTSTLDPKYTGVYPTALAPPAYTEAEQNPEYKVWNIDGWGRYQKDGGLRYDNAMPWSNQNPSSQFDPAAWHLKIIRFPSGGELHVQYEQHDYAYVQNRPAMAMVPLTLNSSENKYYLNLDAAFGSVSNAQRDVLVAQINRYFASVGAQREKMHFRFRYIFSNLESPCNQEDISGYANMLECGKEGTDVYIRLGKTPSLSGFSLSHPIAAAKRFQSTHDKKYFAPCGGATNVFGKDIYDILNILRDLIFDSTFMGLFSTLPSPVLSPQQSYLRIPMPGIPKKGGGVRVKRLLTYSADGALESGDKVLSGSEYLYETFEKQPSGEIRISSGVATNEPSQSREENALIRLINENDFFVNENVVAGDDVIQYEGMLGESLLPSPSVGYSRIVVRGITLNNTTGAVVVNPGFTVYDYLTAGAMIGGKAYPSVECIPTAMERKLDPSNFLLEMLQNSEESIKLTQGYTFMKNNLHGITKAISGYGGIYTTLQNQKQDAFANTYVVSAQEYEYFQPGEELPVMYAPDRPLRMRPIGRQTSVLMEARKTSDVTYNQPWQFSVGVVKEFPGLTGFLMPFMYNKRDNLYQHVTTKIIDNPVIVKKTRAVSDGIVSEVENMVFDATTGSPVVTYTTDGYDGLTLEQSSTHKGGYYSYSIPAHMLYNDIGQYATSAGFVFHNFGKTHEWSMPNVEMNVTVASSALPRGETPVGTCTFGVPVGSSLTTDELLQVKNRLTRLLHTLTPGDLVEMKNIEANVNNPAQPYIGSKGVYYLGAVTNNINTISPSLSFQIFDPHFGSVRGARPDNGKAIGVVNGLEIIRSGKDNNVFSSAGGVVTYGTDVTPAIDCAKRIRAREKYANNLNSWIHAATRSSGAGQQQGLGDAWLLHDQTFTWQSLDGATTYDVPNGYLIPYNPASIPTTIPSTDCFTFQASTPYLYCTNAGSPTNPYSPVKQRFAWRLTKQGVIGSETVSMGWWDYRDQVWVTNAAPGASGELRQDVPYTGHEQFGVNDDGDLVWYDYAAEEGNATRNLTTVFRGAVNSSAVPTTPATPIPQAMGRVNAIPTDILSRVLHTSAQTLKDDWSHDGGDPATYNAYETGKKGRWRPDASYVYRGNGITPTQGSYDETTPGPGGRTNERVYKNAGVFALPALFSYSNPANSLAAGWLQPMTVEKYTEHGNVAQVKDILDMHASSRLAHNDNVQSISAALATSEQINFDSFEDQSGTPISTVVAHTGRKSVALVPGSGDKYASRELSWEKAFGDIQARFWVRGESPTSTVNVEPEATNLSETVLVALDTYNGFDIGKFAIEKIARTGEWTLYQVRVPEKELSGSGSFRLRLSVEKGEKTYYVDDVVIKPWRAEATCYVYEANTLRPLAVLDGEHFALIYQYDGEGKLVRYIKETIKGYKTMGEGFIHIPEDKVRASLLASGGHVLSTIGTGGGSGSAASMRQLIRDQNAEQSTLLDNGSFQLPSQGAQGKVDLLNLNMTPDKTSVQWIGKDSSSVPKVPVMPSMKEPLKNITTPRVNANTLPAIPHTLPVDSLAAEKYRKRVADSLKTRVNSSTKTNKGQR